MNARNYILLCSVAFVFDGTETKADQLRVVALYGHAAPDTALGTSFLRFNPPLIDNAGRVAFKASILGTDDRRPLNDGIWSEATGELELVARGGDHAPGTPKGTYFTTFYWPSMQFNGEGDLTFLADLGGAGVRLSSLRGLWSKYDDSFALVARSGDNAPDIPDLNYDLIGAEFQGDLSSKGETAFRTDLVGSGVDFGNDVGIWIANEAEARLVAREGAGVPGYANGLLYDGLGLPAVNALQQVAFRAELRGDGVTDGNRQFLLTEESGSVHVIARAGERAPGAMEDFVFRGFGHPRTNDAGNVVFVATLRRELQSTSAGSGIWKGSKAALEVVAMEGGPAPGVPLETGFGRFFNPGSDPVAISFNQQSQIAFRNVLTGGDVTDLNDEGVWSERGGELQLIAREGQHAPGTTGDFVFRRGVSGLFDAFGDPVINEAGQSAFLAYVNNGFVNTNSDRGIWAEDSRGQLHLIAREGDLLEIAPGDFRTIRGLEFVGGENANGTGFNDLGQVAFYAEFSPFGEGIFVSDLVAVPELSSAILFALCIAIWLCFRHAARARCAGSDPFFRVFGDARASRSAHRGAPEC